MYEEADDDQWYAIYTRAGQEDRADFNLRAWGVETLYPRFKHRRKNEFRTYSYSRFVIKPLFDRYLFAQFNAKTLLHKISFTRGVAHVVCFGGNPISIDDTMISAVRARISEDGLVKMGGELKKGDQVVIQDGPFTSFLGIFEREMRARDRVVILLTAVKFQSRIVVDRNIVQRAHAYPGV